jgi:murein DD-endopeptidase MepM/ murein hydrolase activator NlpD
LVLNTSVSADYLTKTSDIIPKKEIALTTVPEERKRAEAFVYKVEGGDTLYSIGTKFKISSDALQYVNGISESTVLQVGQELTIPPSLGLIHKVADGETLSSIAKKYDVAVQAVADFNYLFSDTTLAVGSELVIPGAKVPQVVVPVPVVPGVGPTTPAPSVGPNKKLCVWPTTVRYISQNFFWYHNGIDIATPLSGPMPPLLACTGGTVVRAGWDPFGLGLHVRIDHGNGYETVYGHMSRIDVSYGEKVKRGEVIGLMGNTGNSTGPHIHFIVKYKGAALDPLNYTN